MTVLDEGDLKFLQSRSLCRLATASRNLEPHVTPVVYAVDGENVIVALDYGRKKLGNLRENPKVALVVDDYGPNRGLMKQRECEILEKGKDYLRHQKLLYGKFEFSRNDPWKEGESPILRIHPRKCASWGI